MRDDAGVEFRALDQVRDAAETALADLARDEIAAGPARTLRGLMVSVRDEQGRIVCHGSLVLSLEEA